MFSCRPNPTIKYYLTKNHGSSSNPPCRDTVISLDKINPEEIVQYPNYLEQHRKNIIIDYKKKLEQARSLRKRFSFQKNQNQTTIKNKVKTSRESSERRKVDDHSKLFVSTEPSQHHKQSFRVSTINFSLCQTSKEEEKIAPLRETASTFQRETITSFQKNALKILKAKEEIKLKKRLISDEIDERHQDHVDRFQQNSYQRSFRIVTEPRR